MKYNAVEMLSSQETTDFSRWLYYGRHHLTAKIYQLLVSRHYFFDGNKRTSHITAKTFLALYGKYHLKPNYKEAVNFIIEIADDKKKLSEIEKWVRIQSEKIPEKEDVSKHIEKCIQDEVEKMKE